MRRWLAIMGILAACGPGQSFEYDLEPIELSRAAVEPGGPTLGGLMAKVTTSAGVEPYLIDSAYPMNLLARAGCGAGAVPGWTYTGGIELRDATAAAPVRARLKNIGLFDLCPGPTGDATLAAVGVMGGSLLANFSVGFELPREASGRARMTLWPGSPGSDDQLGQDGLASLRFDLRGSATAARADGEASLTLPNARIVLAACAAPRPFSLDEAQETCAQGEVAVKSSGVSLLLALGTGEGPIILGRSAWERVAAHMGVAVDSGTLGELFTPFAAGATSARFLDLPRLAILQGITDSYWAGACAELARARRIEWVFANQNSGACFQACDANGSQIVASRPYVELGGTLRVAVVEDTSDLIRAINADAPPRPRVDGIVGAAALAGLKLRLDYLATPQGRVIANCLDTGDRSSCYVAPACPARDAYCFGQAQRGVAQVCPR
jgi:hypothetical protein